MLRNLIEPLARALRPGAEAAKEQLKRIPYARAAVRELRRRGFLPRLRLGRPGRLEIPRQGRFVALLSERLGVPDVYAARDPLQRMYLDFALSTVERGELVRREIEAHLPVAGKRYLDVGCAYGGFLVAFAEAGARPTGIELNPGFVDFARALLADYSVDFPVRQMNVLDAAATAELGRFDLVTCNDVIEHVDDPRAALGRLVDLLADGGALYLAIPNRHHAAFVLSDGHFQRFGITALPKHLADRYYAELFPGQKHDVTYRSLGFYRNVLARSGAQVTLLNEPKGNLAARLGAIAEDFAACERMAARYERGQGPLRGEVARRVRRLAALYRAQHDAWRALRREDPQRAQILGRRLVLTFGTDFWRLLVRKDVGAGEP